MTEQQTFFATWAQASDALPLVLTGSAAALAAASEFIQPLFPAADVYHLRSEEKTIPIVDVRAMRAAATQSAWGGRRLVIISEAEKLSGAAVQTLLKILEEPTRSTRFILTTRWYRRLLPTIRSRCIHVALKHTELVSTTSATTLPHSLLARLAAFSGDTPLDAETMQQIIRALEQQLRLSGPTPALRAAYLRLKDYYLVTSFPGSNQKLARDILLASLPKEL